MPKDLLLEPIGVAAKPNSATTIDTNPWAPVAAIGGQEQIILYNTDTLQIAGILPFPEGYSTTLKFSRNGKLLLAAGGIGAKQGQVVVWDIETGDRAIELGDDYDTIQAADIHLTMLILLPVGRINLSTFTILWMAVDFITLKNTPTG